MKRTVLTLAAPAAAAIALAGCSDGAPSVSSTPAAPSSTAQGSTGSSSSAPSAPSSSADAPGPSSASSSTPAPSGSPAAAPITGDTISATDLIDTADTALRAQQTFRMKLTSDAISLSGMARCGDPVAWQLERAGAKNIHVNRKAYTVLPGGRATVRDDKSSSPTDDNPCSFKKTMTREGRNTTYKVTARNQSSDGVSGLTKLTSEARPGKKPITLWVDGSRRPIRLEATSARGTTSSIVYSDFGSPVTITAPPNATSAPGGSKSGATKSGATT